MLGSQRSVWLSCGISQSYVVSFCSLIPDPLTVYMCFGGVLYRMEKALPLSMICFVNGNGNISFDGFLVFRLVFACKIGSFGV